MDASWDGAEAGPANAASAGDAAAHKRRVAAAASSRSSSQSSRGSAIRSRSSSATWQSRLSRESRRILPLKYALATRPGRSVGGHSKRNQDAHGFHARLMGLPHVHLAIVADGHGPLGHEASRITVDEFPGALESELQLLGAHRHFRELGPSLNGTKVRHLLDMCAQAAQRACSSVDAAVTRRRDARLSGSTLVGCLLVGNHAISINVGDSRCVLGRADGAASVAKRITVDHDLTAPGEQSRIRSHGGVIRAFSLPDGTQAGPLRVWSPAEGMRKPGLAMSRSIGDVVAAQVGVVCDPALSYARLKPRRDRSLILASDGIWDVMSDAEAVELVAQHGSDVAASASAVCDIAHSRWVRETGVEGRVDDITAIIIVLWPDAECAAAETPPVATAATAAAGGAGKAATDDGVCAAADKPSTTAAPSRRPSRSPMAEAGKAAMSHLR